MPDTDGRQGERRGGERRKGKAPSLPWYPKDFEGDEVVKLMTYEEEGIYRRLLDHQWFHMGIPSDPSQIARLVPKVSLQKFLRLWPSMSRKFEPTGDGRIANPKLERVRSEWDAYKAQRSEAGKASAEARAQRNSNGHSNGA